MGMQTDREINRAIDRHIQRQSQQQHMLCFAKTCIPGKNGLYFTFRFANDKMVDFLKKV